jgi:hypothetical protein
MLYSSLSYVGSSTFLGVNAAWVGVGVLALGGVLMAFLGSVRGESKALKR